MTCGIYKITNKKDGKVYIGQSVNIERRFSEHCSKRPLIDDFIAVLGKDNFEFEILEETSQEELSEKEKQYIEKTQANNPEKGYNQTTGGEGSVGEANGRARLTEKDVFFIREKYRMRSRQKEVWETYFKDKITFSSFQRVWQGSAWEHVHMDVYTDENKKYYATEINRTPEILKLEDLLRYRKYYVDHKQSEVWDLFVSEYGEALRKSSFYKILRGDVKENSIYNTIPVYLKKQKKWIDKSKPVQTIPESGK